MDQVTDELVEPVGGETAVDEQRGHGLGGVEEDEGAGGPGPADVDAGLGQPVGEGPPVRFGGDGDGHPAGGDGLGQIPPHALGQLVVVPVELHDVIVRRREQITCERHRPSLLTAHRGTAPSTGLYPAPPPVESWRFLPSQDSLGSVKQKQVRPSPSRS